MTLVFFLPGVILPGETLRFPFVFKSPNAGVFSEQWNLETRPVVCGGAALLVTLRGVALQEDKFKDQREKLERELVQRQAQQVVGHILYEVVSGIRTPDRARSPVDAYVTEEEIFRRNNPGLEYSHEHVAKLAEIYGQLFEEEYRAENVWSLSVADLQESILQLGEEDDDKKENLLHQMNTLVGQLSYVPLAPLEQRLHAAGYQLMVEAIDRMVGEALLLRHSMNLPDREQDDIDGDTHYSATCRSSRNSIDYMRDGLQTPKSGDSRKGARAAEAKSKGDAGKDKGKGAAKDAKAAKGGGGKAEGKGKPSASTAAQKKTPTPASKSTVPTPAPTTARVPTPGDKDGGQESGTSHPGSPDPNVTTGSNGTSLNDSELAVAERLYKDSFTVQAYNILGEMTEKMDTIFSALREEAENHLGS
ncbi:mycbp-associated protein-like isoform x1 [Plakobranchus ocellatus]|uniref:Mycbp-associated protein-like isoform x1 n=1 Tax=Plakobranchus ocellatus TaxID=259542 RepID=A0AAV4DTV4_9GAST|nr:mycbp-associated protein-like isoform x1 [Plakobranchus ocellatus]